MSYTRVNGTPVTADNRTHLGIFLMGCLPIVSLPVMRIETERRRGQSHHRDNETRYFHVLTHNVEDKPSSLISLIHFSPRRYSLIEWIQNWIAKQSGGQLYLYPTNLSIQKRLGGGGGVRGALKVTQRDHPRARLSVPHSGLFSISGKNLDIRLLMLWAFYNGKIR